MLKYFPVLPRKKFAVFCPKSLDELVAFVYDYRVTFCNFLRDYKLT